MSIDDRIKTSKQKLGEKISCSIEVLTPVHIGSGVKLTEGIDFIKNNSSVHIIPQSILLKYLEENSEERDNFIKGDYKLSALKRVPDGIRYNIAIGKSTEIYEFERNGNGKPYIPGSSIKGAIRTILLKKRFDGLTPNEQSNLLGIVTSTRKEWAAEPVIRALFGGSPNENLMRVLEIFDAEFDMLELEKVLILSLTNSNGTSYGWKQLWSRQNTSDHKKASEIVVEALPIGSKGYFSMQLNNFLLIDKTAKEKLKFNEPSINNIKNLISVINNYSQEKLENEKQFFKNLKSPYELTSVINTIDNLLNMRNNLNDNEFILRISWGSGWKGMTGDYLDANWLNIFRNKYNLGKKGFSVFPKTRRIIFEDDVPKYLTGWVKIKLYDKEPLIKENENVESEKSLVMDPLDKLRDKFKVTVSNKKR